MCHFVRQVHLYHTTINQSYAPIYLHAEVQEVICRIIRRSVEGGEVAHRLHLKVKLGA